MVAEEEMHGSPWMPEALILENAMGLVVAVAAA
jgi:hypothetical protein